jgi:DNA polymerase-1
LADYKGFVGDKSDNIPGVPGIGPKSAALLINKFGILENTYKEIGELGLSDIKLQEKLAAHRSQAFLSKRLATLDYDAPISVTLKELEVPLKLNTTKIRDYFSDLGFNSLIERVAKL